MANSINYVQKEDKMKKPAPKPETKKMEKKEVHAKGAMPMPMKGGKKKC